METVRLDRYHAPEETLAALSGETRLLCLGARGSRHVLMATEFEEVPLEDLLGARVWRKSSSGPWAPRHVIMASYSDFAEDGGARSRAFRLRAGWVWDQKKREIHHLGPLKNGRPKLPPLENFEPSQGPLARLTAQADDYESLCRRAIEDIRSGRYYQINLLRYFHAEILDQDTLCTRWWERAGDMGMFLRTPSLELLSFSPERLLVVTSKDEGLHAIAEPIKGTVAVGDDPEERKAARRFLASARKERAELAIITDLLRNDLFGIARRHGVRVLDRGAPVSAAGVEHFKSIIEADCSKELTVGAIMKALLPGGSITGAPKREVMKAIFEYEKRPRDFFMGSVFAFDERRGLLDASILIRTLARHPSRGWEYAAGSGLTTASEPESEALEILAKCRVVSGANA